MTLVSLDDWFLSGKELRKLIHEAGFNSPYSFSQYFAINYTKVQRWLKMDTVPDGRLIGCALIGLKYKAQCERLEREIEILKKQLEHCQEAA